MPIKFIGTSHIAKQAVKKVRKTILEEKPDIVCVELDVIRFRNLINPKRKTISLKDIKQLGAFGFLFALVGQWVQKKLGEQVGIIPGADMKEAILVAKTIGAKIYLIDQPIQKTIYNLSKKVPIWEKVKLVFYLLFGSTFKENKEVIKKINLNKIPSKEIINELVKNLKEKFPNIYAVLVDDRNKYMAKAVNLIYKTNKHKKIIVVIGAGHIRGVKNLLIKNAF